MAYDYELDSGGGPADEPKWNPSENSPQQNPTGGDPWTADELAKAQAWAKDYYTSHQIPAGWGEVQDLVNNYMQQRRNGVGHQQAMDTVPGLLGWDKYQAPTTPTNPPGGNGGGGGGVGPAPAGTGAAPTPFNWPGFTPPPVPTLTPYTYTPFSYDKFSAPTLEEAQNRPGYQFGLQQGQGALLNAAAKMGVARGGGTLKNLFDYTNAAAEQNYGNVFNQDLTGYTTNRDTAFNTWAANTGQQGKVVDTANQNAQNTYSNLRQNAADVFNPQFDAAKMSFSDMYSRWLAKLNSLTSIATSGANA